MMQPVTPQSVSRPESARAAPSAEPTLAAVIPAYNEGLVIGSVVLQARKHADRVIVVDDGSLDRTAETARLAGADVIRFEENGGKAKIDSVADSWFLNLGERSRHRNIAWQFGSD